MDKILASNLEAANIVLSLEGYLKADLTPTSLPASFNSKTSPRVPCRFALSGLSTVRKIVVHSLDLLSFPSSHATDRMAVMLTSKMPISPRIELKHARFCFRGTRQDLGSVTAAHGRVQVRPTLLFRHFCDSLQYQGTHDMPHAQRRMCPPLRPGPSV